jgi:RNA polymerase sigma-70 factor (ECF subfamily)
MQGDPAAQEALFRRYAALATGLAHRLLAGDPEVDDLVQDAFVIALRNLSTLRAPEAFSTWLGSIVVRTASKKLRRRRLLERLGLRRSEPIDCDTLIGSEAPPELAAELRDVYTALDRLRPDERLALVLQRVEGQSLAEIAQSLGVSLATAKRRLQTAEARLGRFRSVQEAT